MYYRVYYRVNHRVYYSVYHRMECTSGSIVLQDVLYYSMNCTSGCTVHTGCTALESVLYYWVYCNTECTLLQRKLYNRVCCITGCSTLLKNVLYNSRRKIKMKIERTNGWHMNLWTISHNIPSCNVVSDKIVPLGDPPFIFQTKPIISRSPRKSKQNPHVVIKKNLKSIKKNYLNLIQWIIL